MNEIPAQPNRTHTAPELVEALLAQNTPVWIQAHGPSMNPLIRDGDHVRVRPINAEHIRPGHVLLFRQHGRLVLHRCIRRPAAGLLQVTGDAALEGVDTVPGDAVIGCAECVDRGAGARRLDHAVARGAGLALYHARPLRRWLLRITRMR